MKIVRGFCETNGKLLGVFCSATNGADELAMAAPAFTPSKPPGPEPATRGSDLLRTRERELSFSIP